MCKHTSPFTNCLRALPTWDDDFTSNCMPTAKDIRTWLLVQTTGFLKKINDSYLCIHFKILWLLNYRPKTAGPRYREWKVWLTEKLKRDEERARENKATSERRRANILAFEKWLMNKEKMASSQYHLALSDSEDEAPSPRPTTARCNSQRNATPKNSGTKVSRKAIVYQLQNTDPTPTVRSDPNSNMRAHQKWQINRNKYGIKRATLTDYQRRNLENFKAALLMEGMTYEEWMVLKEREQAVKWPSFICAP